MFDWIPEPVLEILRIPAIEAVGLLFAAMVVGKIIDWVLTGVMSRAARKSVTDFDDRLIETLHRPLFLSSLLLGLYLALGVLQLGPPYDWLVAGLIKTLAMMIWATAIMRLITVVIEWLGRLAGRTEWVNARLLPLFDNVLKLVVVAVAVYGLLVIWHLDVKPWLASAGIVGLAVGLAAKDSLANLFGGMSLIIDAPYQVGDYVNLDGGERGQVTKIGLRSTRILTRDDLEVTLPNSVIANSKIINESGGRWLKSRIRIKVSVAYGSSVEEVRRVLEQVAADEQMVVAEPAPRVRFRAMGDSSLNFELLCWIAEPELRGRVADALNTRAYNAFNAAGIEIPFPQRVVHIRQPIAEVSEDS